jgi:hypothetical protein
LAGTAMDKYFDSNISRRRTNGRTRLSISVRENCATKLDTNAPFDLHCGGSTIDCRNWQLL